MKKKLKKAQYGIGTNVPKTSPEMIPNVANVEAYRDSIVNEAYVNMNNNMNRQDAYQLEKVKLTRDLQLAKNEALRKHLLNTLPPMITPIKSKNK
jgi:hypothetical protein|tara:strand:- start:144 stop:428 length:285 start_codon:yes stop_codon:yes gene_type:complete